jgi:HIRAN domain
MTRELIVTFGSGSRAPIGGRQYSSVSWLQAPAISIGAAVRVVGTSFHQDELEVIAGGRNFAGTRRRLLTVTLIREPDNPHDENAVRVDAAGVPVGHLSREDAPLFHSIIQRVAANAATCRAELIGGWDQGRGDHGSIGMEILTGLRPSGWTGRAAFLPDSPWHENIAVTLEANRMPARSVVTLRNTNAGVAVLRGDAFVGEIVDRPDLADLVHRVQEAGLPTTANARLTTNGKLIVTVADPDAVAKRLHLLGSRDLRHIQATTRPTGRWLCKRCGSIWSDSRRQPRHACPQCGGYAFTLPL